MRPGVNGFSSVSQTNGQWVQAYVPLNFEMKQGSAYFGFTIDDQTGSQGHFRVDDFQVTCNDGQYPDPRRAYGFAEGTSFAAPLAAGTAVLVREAFPDLSPEATKWAVVSGGDPSPATDYPTPPEPPPVPKQGPPASPDLLPKTIGGTRLDASGALRVASQISRGDASCVATSLSLGAVPPGTRTLFAQNTLPSGEGATRSAGEVLDFLAPEFRFWAEISGLLPTRPPSAVQGVQFCLTTQIGNSTAGGPDLKGAAVGRALLAISQVVAQARTKLREERLRHPYGQAADVDVDVTCSNATCSVQVSEKGTQPPPAGDPLRARGDGTTLEGSKRIEVTIDGTSGRPPPCSPWPCNEPFIR